MPRALLALLCLQLWCGLLTAQDSPPMPRQEPAERIGSVSQNSERPTLVAQLGHSSFVYAVAQR